MIAHVNLGQGLDTDNGNVREHGQRCATDDRPGNRGNHCASLRQDAEDDHNDAGCSDNPAGLHAGQSNQTDVLGEAGVGERVEDATEEGG